MKRILILSIVLLSVVVASADVLQTSTAVFTGTVMRVEGELIFVKGERGEMGVARKDVVKLDAAAPAEYGAGTAALKAGNLTEAVAAFKAVVDRFGGLPIGWAMESMLKLVDAYLMQKDMPSAEAAITQTKKLYPEYVGALKIKQARLLFVDKKYDEAMEIAQKYLDVQLKKDYISVDREVIVADALVLLGDCYIAKDQLWPALDSYLKVVTLYDYDDVKEAEARFKAAQILEKQRNWKRAKESYDELVKAIPDSKYVAEAKRLSKAIAEAHPE